MNTLYLVCRLKDRLCGLPAAHVVETMRPMAVRPIAESPPFVLGVSLIRGEPVPVLDAASLLGAPKSPGGRFVTVQIDTRRVALSVDAVLGLFPIPANSMAGLPPLLGEASSEVVSALRILDNELLYLLNSARMVPDSLWATLKEQNGVK